VRRVRVVVEGRVQGVLFRESARRRAAELGVRGFVRNLPDGRVEAVFEGSERAVDDAVYFMRKGPPLADVKGVEELPERPTGEFSSFRVR